MQLEALLERVDRDGEEAALSWLLERGEEFPLEWLSIVPGPRALDWLEARLASPVVEEWGRTAALVGISWPRIAAWLAGGRPHSLAALDALVTYTRVGAAAHPLASNVQPVLPEPPTHAELRASLEALARVDDSPRATTTITQILARADDLLRGGPATARSARSIYAHEVERRREAEEASAVAQTAERTRALAAIRRVLRQAPAGSRTIRDEVLAFAALGPLPDENASEVVIARHQAQLERIRAPVTAGEAMVLVELFGPDDCYGLAWSLLHLIESAPDGAPLACEPGEDANAWVRELWARAHR